MNIALIDADLIGRKKHRFPNLALMKISGYYKNLKNNVTLKTDYENLEQFDKVFISKVFTDTIVPIEALSNSNIELGGTGFFYDKAKFLDYELEHHMPDYNLYNEWVSIQLKNGVKKKHLEYYTDYSIGFTTRGCFRKCSFCVNKNYNNVEIHSPVYEFLDNGKNKICLLDDNILGSKCWESIINELKLTKKSFQYKQGLDVRILNDEKAKLLLSCKYDEDYIFAFDNIDDKEEIESKLKLWKRYNITKGQNTKLYVFCGFDRDNKWDIDFWKQDIIDVFERIKILMKYNCKPYIMRFNRYEESPYRGMYINIAQWCNQPSLFSQMSYREMCEKDNERKGGNSATIRYNNQFEKENPEISKKYFDLNIKNIDKYIFKNNF